MWRLIWFLQGYVQAELRGASPEWALERLSNARVAFLRVQRIDDFTIALLILRKDVPKPTPRLCSARRISASGTVSFPTTS